MLSNINLASVSKHVKRKFWNLLTHIIQFIKSSNILGKMLNTHMKIYNFLIVGDFNSEMTESAMENFYGTCYLHNLIKDPICFKNSDTPSCIDLLLTNFPESFSKSKIGFP